jgi:rhamnosyltransferase
MSTSVPKASVILLTHNSAKTIRGVLDGVIKQKFTDFEILLIDSSSTDDTISIAEKFPCRIISIKPEDFGHGKTRNYAARLAKGEFVIFLTHDSVPNCDDWLEELLEPFKNKKVVGVYGIQVPRKDENTLDKYFQKSLYGRKRIVWVSSNWRQGDNLFSDANSAVRRSILLRTPYADDIIVSEDYEWASRVLELGFIIVYNPRASVTHSHSYNMRSLFRRNFDIGVSFKTIYKKSDLHNFISKGSTIFTWEVKYLIQSGNAIFIPEAIWCDIIRFTAIQIGKHESLLPRKLKRNYFSAQKWYWK